MNTSYHSHQKESQEATVLWNRTLKCYILLDNKEINKIKSIYAAVNTCSSLDLLNKDVQKSKITLQDIWLDLSLYMGLELKSRATFINKNFKNL